MWPLKWKLSVNEYILMVLFAVLLKRVHVFQMKPKGVTIQMKALDEDILLVLYVCVVTEESF